jgi:hypothetical protein
LAFAAERALDLVGHSALLAENANRDLAVSVPGFFVFRSFHDLIQITFAIGGTGCAVEPAILTPLDGSLW